MPILNKQIISFTSFFSCSAYTFDAGCLSGLCHLSSRIAKSAKRQLCAHSCVPCLLPQGPHMVTEELHSISFETQVCLYGLTINLEVSTLAGFSGAKIKSLFQQFM